MHAMDTGLVPLNELKEQSIERIKNADSQDDLVIIEKELFGRKSGLITLHMHALRTLPDSERRSRGGEINKIKKEVENELKSRKSFLEKKQMDSLSEEDLLDVTMDLPNTESGHLHLIPEFISKVEEVFGRMGFDTAYGPEIETEEYNFDLLNFPKGHAARDMQDTFWVGDRDGEQRVLRTHTSPVQIRYAKEHKPPFRMICPGKVYRKDADATHSPMFHQFEGMMIGKDISLKHLKGVMVTAMKELLSPDLDFRFRAGFFPFTEPSLEMDIKWQGDLSKSREGQWLEVAGCGMTHPNVLRNVGIDPDEWQGFAFGFGIERLLMIKHQIPNIRLFYLGDLKFLRQF
jgi:phenylalanyl-tRNA synthetase alpha chain